MNRVGLCPSGHEILSSCPPTLREGISKGFGVTEWGCVPLSFGLTSHVPSLTVSDGPREGKVDCGPDDRVNEEVRVVDECVEA